MVTLGEYVDKIDTFDLRERFQAGSGLGDMYGYLDALPGWNRWLLWLQVQIYFRGQQREGYASTFQMYRGLRRIVKGGAPSRPGRKES